MCLLCGYAYDCSLVWNGGVTWWPAAPLGTPCLPQQALYCGRTRRRVRFVGVQLSAAMVSVKLLLLLLPLSLRVVGRPLFVACHVRPHPVCSFFAVVAQG